MPPLSGRVNDLAGLLSESQRSALEARLARFEQKTSHQIVVLTVPSLGGEPIETYSMRVVEAWKIGHKGLDNGALLLVAPTEHRVRIEVGYGLEGVVPDVIAKRIIEDVMVPRFRAGDFPGGIAAGSEALMHAAAGEQIPPERRPRARAQPGPDAVHGVLFAAVLAGFVGALLGRRRLLLGAGMAGVLGAGFAYALLRTALAAGAGLVLAAVLSLFFGGGGGRRGFGPGGWYGGGFGGGGFGGGGFSGGGGGFGGGGASGSW